MSYRLLDTFRATFEGKRYIHTVPPMHYLFSWADLKATELDYGAILTRISREYDRRFRD